MGESDSPRALPLFPLDAVVLFPGTRVPLHVFEPRYRQMTRDVLAGDGWIGMIAVRPEHHHALAGSPPLYAVGCAGYVERWRELSEGRFHLVLAGRSRFRLLRELAPDGRRLYRSAEVELLGEGDAAGCGDAPALRERVLELLEQTTRLRGGDARSERGTREELEGLDAAQLANALAQSAPLSTAERQGLLEAEGPAARLERLEGALRFQLAALRETGSSDPRTVH